MKFITKIPVSIAKQYLGRGGGLFGVNLGGNMLRGAWDTFGADLSFAQFESEQFSTSLKTTSTKAGIQLAVGQSLVVGGTIWTIRKLKMSERYSAIYPIFDYLDELNGRLTGGAKPKSVLADRAQFQQDLADLGRPVTIDDFAKGGALTKPTSSSLTNILLTASEELATATDPDDIAFLRTVIQNAAIDVKITSQKIGAVSDALEYLNTIDVNPVLAKSIAQADLPDDVLSLIPDLVELLQEPEDLPRGVRKGLAKQFGSELVGGGNEIASASRGIASAGFSLTNNLTQVQTGDFVGGDFPDVDEILKKPPQLTPNEVAAVSDEIAKINKNVKQFNKGVKGVKLSITTGKWLARANLLGIADLVYWLGSSVVDLALNWADIPEENQRIELGDSWFANFLEQFADLSEGVGTSPFDILVFNPILKLLIPDDPYATLVEIVSGEFSTLDALMLAIVTFWIEEIQIDLNTPIDIEVGLDEPIVVETSLPVPSIEPLDILAVATVACVAKIVFNGWVVPAWRAFQSTVSQTT